MQFNKKFLFYSFFFIFTVIFCIPEVQAIEELSLNCFANNQIDCQYLSSNHQIVIGRLQDQEFNLLVKNSGNTDCQLKLQLIPDQQNNQLREILENSRLIISNKNEILFTNQLSKIVDSSQNLQEITAGSEENFLFSFNFWSALEEVQEIDFHFKLSLSFNCSDEQELKRNDLLTATESSNTIVSEDYASNSVELVADLNDSLPESKKNNTKLVIFLIGVFTSLVIVAFFVIMKKRHGKKQQNPKASR